MIRQLKQFTLRLTAGANVATVVLMLVAGFSDRIDPGLLPLLACMGMLFPFFLLANLLFLLFWLFCHWKSAWIPILGFVLAYVPINIYIPVRVMDTPPEGSLKLLSYNVHGYSGMQWGQNTFDSIFSYLLAQQADIVCLVEDNDTWRHSDVIFAEHFAHNKRVQISSNNRKLVNHIGLHTRFPIVGAERIDLPSQTESNGAAAFLVKTATDTVMVVGCHLENIHLNSQERSKYKKILKGEVEKDSAKTEGMNIVGKLSGAFKVRARQVEALSKYIDEHRHNYPVLVCGDFNDTPISYSRHVIARHLTDCFQTSGCGLGLSYNQKGFNFRIDYLFCSEDFHPYSCQIDAKMGASDHYPLICWLKKGHNP